jgi:hypothetical protein
MQVSSLITVQHYYVVINIYMHTLSVFFWWLSTYTDIAGQASGRLHR